MNPQRIQSSPFKGLVPYSEADAQFFFGREGIRDTIIDMMEARRITLLFGASGVGKSSVLHAGVVPRLHQLARERMMESQRSRPEFAVVTFNSWRDDPSAGLAGRIEKALAEFLEVPAQPSPSGATLIQAMDKWLKETDAQLFIILDQFEEYFQYHVSAQGAGAVSTELPRTLSRADRRIKFLISMRDDAVAKLDQLNVRIPNLFDNRLRVRPLNSDEAREAIEGPIREYNKSGEREPVTIEPELLKAVLDSVRRDEIITDRGGVQPGEANLDAAILQQVMTKLWEVDIERDGSDVLRLETFEKLGGAQKIVSNHFSSAMAKLSPTDQKTAAAIFRYLVTPSGAKIAQTACDLAGYSELSDTWVRSVLEKLSGSDIRILRAISPPPNQKGEVRYEIFHDVLSGPIIDWWRSFEADAKAEEQARIQAQAVRAKYAVGVVVGLLLALGLLSVLTAYAFRQKSIAAERAENEKNAKLGEAEATKRAVQWAEKEAAAREAAQIEAKKARDAQAEAEKSKNQAVEALRLADERTNAMIAARTTDSLYRQAFRQSRRTDLKEDAIENFKKALQVYIKNPGEINHQAATDTYLNIGEVYIDIGNEASASKSFDDALGRCRNEIERASVLTNIGDSYKEVEQWAIGYDVDPKRIAVDKYSQALSIYQGSDDSGNAAAVLLNLALLKYQSLANTTNSDVSPEREEALRLMESAIELYRRKGDHKGHGFALYTLANIKAQQFYLSNEVVQTVIDKMEEALEEFVRAKDIPRQIMVRKRLVRLYEQAQEPKKSLANLEAIVQLYKQLKDDTALTATLADKALFNLKHTKPTEREYVTYVADYGKAAALYEKAQRYDKAAFAWRKVGDYYRVANRTSEATKAYEKAADLFHLDEDHQREILALYDLAISFGPTDKSQAVRYLDKIKRVVDLLSPRERAPGHFYLGSGFLAMNEFDQAKNHFDESLRIYKQFDDRTGERSTLDRISSAYLAREMGDEAIKYLTELLKLSPGSSLGEAQTHMSLALAYVKKKQINQAIEYYERAATLYKDQKYFSGQIRALHEVGKLQYSATNFPKAIETLENVRNLLPLVAYADGAPLTLLAETYAASKQNKKAIEVYEDAAKAYYERKQWLEQSKSLLAISHLYKSDGDEKKAEEYKQKADQAAKSASPTTFAPPPSRSEER